MFTVKIIACKFSVILGSIDHISFWGFFVALKLPEYNIRTFRGSCVCVDGGDGGLTLIVEVNSHGATGTATAIDKSNRLHCS